MINVKADKTCRTGNDRMKKNGSLNRIWPKLRRGNPKLKLMLKILKKHMNEAVLTVSYFPEMLMCVEPVNRYSAIFFMLIALRFMTSFLNIVYLNFLYDILDID